MKKCWCCPECQLAWPAKLSPADYEAEYYQGKSSLASQLFRPIEMFFYALRRRYAGGGREKFWLDVGAGEGGFLKSVKAERRLGVEISASGRKMMEKLGLETMTEKKFLKSKELKAGIISFWHVLEHTKKPWDYLEAAKKNLSPKGKIVIGVPNIDSFEFRFFGQDWFHLQPQYHFWYFTPQSMAKLLRKTGFRIEKIDYWSLEHHPTGVLQSFVNRTSGSNNVLHKLIKRQAGFSSLKAKDIFWSFFWLTLGLPVVFLFWFFGSLFKKSGTVVLVAIPLKL